MGLPQDWFTTNIILLYQYYNKLERSIASLDTISRHLLHVDHPLNFQCHPLQFVCSLFKVKGEGELIGEVMVEMVGGVVVEMVSKVVITMVREVVVHLSRHCHHYHTLQYYFSPDNSIRSHTYPSSDTFIHSKTYTSHFIASHTYTSVETSTPHVIPPLSPTSPPLQTPFCHLRCLQS